MTTWEELLPFHGQFNAIHNFFKRDPEVAARYARYPKDVDILQGRDVALTDNAFPWLLAPNLSQKILWSSRPLSASEIEERVPPGCIWFKNAPQCQSRPDIWHCHVFIRSPA